MGITLYNMRRDLDLDLIERETIQNVRLKERVFPSLLVTQIHFRLNINFDVFFTIFNGYYTYELINMLEFVFRVISWYT